MITLFNVFQYSGTNLIHILLRIKGLYMFRAVLAHPQEALNKQLLVYCVRVMLVGCYQDWSGTGVRDASSTPIQGVIYLPYVKYLR
jgi:hypothetical protein